MPLLRQPLAWVVFAALLGLASAASARHGSAHAAHGKASDESADRRLRAGEAALQAGDLVGAERAFGESYRAHRSQVALFHLGRVALAQQRAVAAQDFMRRFLSAPESQQAPPEQRAEAERALTSALPSGEVAVLGEPGGLVLLDGHLVAILPLQLPLLCPPGSHEVRLELPAPSQQAPQVATVNVKAERQVEVRFDRSAAAVMVSERKAVLLLLHESGWPDGTKARLQQAVVERLRNERLTALPAKTPPAKDCPSAQRCQLAMLSERSLPQALVIEVAGKDAARPDAQDVHTTVSLLDAEVGEVAHQLEQRCEGCSVDALAAQLAAASAEVVALGLSRRRGELAVVSEPAGALLELSGRVVGPTPYHGVRFAGSYAAVLRHPGYRDYTQAIVVEEGKPAELRVKLDPKVVVTAPPKPLRTSQLVRFRELQPRPRWRLLLGGGLIVGGALTAGFGAGALGVDGQCRDVPVPPAQQCEQRFSTVPLGAGLVGAGAAVSLIGAILMAVPGPHRDYAATVPLVPCATPEGQAAPAEPRMCAAPVKGGP